MTTTVQPQADIALVLRKASLETLANGTQFSVRGPFIPFFEASKSQQSQYEFIRTRNDVYRFHVRDANIDLSVTRHAPHEYTYELHPRDDSRDTAKDMRIASINLLSYLQKNKYQVTIKE